MLYVLYIQLYKIINLMLIRLASKTVIPLTIALIE
jgi:hypothetical protein